MCTMSKGAVTQEQLEKALEMVRAGSSLREVAKQFDVSVTTVYVWTKKAGMDLSKRRKSYDWESVRE